MPTTWCRRRRSASRRIPRQRRKVARHVRKLPRRQPLRTITAGIRLSAPSQPQQAASNYDDGGASGYDDGATPATTTGAAPATTATPRRAAASMHMHAISCSSGFLSWRSRRAHRLPRNFRYRSRRSPIDATTALGIEGPILVVERGVQTPDGVVTIAALTSLAPAREAMRTVAIVLAIAMLGSLCDSRGALVVRRRAHARAGRAHARGGRDDIHRRLEPPLARAGARSRPGTAGNHVQ